jgi:hypothetical protein
MSLGMWTNVVLYYALRHRYHITSTRQVFNPLRGIWAWQVDLVHIEAKSDKLSPRDLRDLRILRSKGQAMIRRQF